VTYHTNTSIKVTPESLGCYKKAAERCRLSVNGWVKSSLNSASGGSIERSFKTVKKKKFKHRKKVEVRSQSQNVVFASEDFEKYEKKALEANMSVYEWIRIVLDHSAGISNIQRHIGG
jgi:predicted HicB family RNase H-like nuclease